MSALQARHSNASGALPVIWLLALVLTAACDASPPPPEEEGDQVVEGRSGDGRGGGPAPCAHIDAYVRRVRRGYVGFASPDLLLIPREPNYVGPADTPVHSGPWPYLVEVPLVLYGPGHIRPAGPISGPTAMVDVAPTIAELIDFEGWPRRAGRVLDEVLEARRGSPPRLVVTVVWDGGGSNVLREHPRSWPVLRRLGRRGASYTDMTIGSSPSVTPPIHATLGTGAWPRAHGIPGLRVRTKAHGYVDPMALADPSRLRVPTLADLYDRARGNRPVAGLLASGPWHLGMLGHGALTPGGDSDPAALLRGPTGIHTNLAAYALPFGDDEALLASHVRWLDVADGAADGRWRTHPLDDETVLAASPANVAYERDLLERLLRRERFGADRVPDLLFVNFKASDEAGHLWGMTSREVGDVVRAQDRALGRLVDHLDRTVGGQRWVLAVTADHGQTPYPEESGGWPVHGGELARDANARWDNTSDGAGLVDRIVSAGAYVRSAQLAANGISLERLARWIAGYTARENARGELPGTFDGAPGDALFDAVVIEGRKVVGRCGAGGKAPRAP